MHRELKLSWGYGLGSVVRVAENLFGFYLIYYLSTVAGVDTAAAGAIGGSALLVGAIASPIIGYLSDRSRSDYGKRRPVMLVTVVPAMIFLTLLFTVVDLGSFTTFYYFAAAILFALFYYGFLVPYDALGASLTSDYHGRATIRSICTAMLYISVLVGASLVIQVQTLLSVVMPLHAAWTVAVIVCCSFPGTLFGLIAWRVTRGAEDESGTIAKSSVRETSVASLVSIFRLRPVRAILLWGFFYFFADAMMAGTFIYLGVFVLGLSESATSTLLVVAIATALVMVLPINVVVKRIGKRAAILSGTAIFVVIALVVLATGFHGWWSGAVLAATYGVCNSIALSCSYAMIYDIREVTELQTGQDHTAIILGWFSLVIGSSAALAAATIGSVLELAGFDAEGQISDAGLQAIIAMQTWGPACLLVIASGALLFWNISSRTHSEMTAQIRQRAAAQENEQPLPSR